MHSGPQYWQAGRAHSRKYTFYNTFYLNFEQFIFDKAKSIQY
jgi:hypothetical protein